MNSTVTRLTEQFSSWINASTSTRPLKIFRVVFALIWIFYDTVDFMFGEVARNFIAKPDAPLRPLALCQGLLILSELGLLFGWRARNFALLCFGLRLWQSTFFPLNDYFYFCSTALILSQCDISNENGDQGAKWPKDVLIFQTAWIYFSTALLKLNPSWLSGGDLYVRFRYLSFSHHWPYPAFFEKMADSLTFNATLAEIGVVLELGIALLLLYHWSIEPKSNPWVKRSLLMITAGVHIFAALTLNVWFFSASMIAQVWILTL